MWPSASWVSRAAAALPAPASLGPLPALFETQFFQACAGRPTTHTVTGEAEGSDVLDKSCHRPCDRGCPPPSPGLLQGPRPGPPSPRLPLASSRCPAGIGSGTAGESAEGLRAGGGPSGARGSWGLRAVVPRPLPLVGGKAPSTRAREPTHVSHPPAWGLGLPRPVPRRPRARSNVPSPRGGPEQLRLAWGSGCGASPLPRGLNRGSCCQRIWCHARPTRGHYPRPLHQRAVGVFGRTGSTASNYSVGCWLLFHVTDFFFF